MATAVSLDVLRNTHDPQRLAAMEYENAVARIYEHLESDKVEQAVMACLRAARAAKDYLNAAIFLRELYPNKNEVARALYDDIAPLKKEAQQFVFEKSLERWLDLHTIESFTSGRLRRRNGAIARQRAVSEPPASVLGRKNNGLDFEGDAAGGA